MKVQTFLLAIIGGVLYFLDSGRLVPLTAGLVVLGGWLLIYSSPFCWVYLSRRQQSPISGSLVFHLLFNKFSVQEPAE